MEGYMMVVYILMGCWCIFSISYVIRVKAKGIHEVNLDVYNTLPSVFTTIGVLGTFLGIYFGLKDFDVENITSSIPILLQGLKTAFTTSILGVSLSLFFGRITPFVLQNAEKNGPSQSTDELAALQVIGQTLSDTRLETDRNLQTLNNSIVGESDSSVATQFVKLRNQISDIQKTGENQNSSLAKIQGSLGGDEETSLLTQIQKLRAEQTEISKDTKKNVDWIVESMNKNNQLISTKFDEFSDLLAKNNTEALVEVMHKATEEFNAQMSALIEKLVQENFQELNTSVQRMNDWQRENKERIETLTDQFIKVSKNFGIAAESMTEITENTSKLTNENGHLVRLIEELQKVMIDDTKYQEIVGELTSTVNTIKLNTEAFDETTNKLNDWVRNQMNFSDSVAILLSKLEEIDKIKDVNDIFWNDTRTQLNEGVSIIATASKRLSSDVENINEEFYARLNDTLQSLDALIQRTIENYR